MTSRYGDATSFSAYMQSTGEVVAIAITDRDGADRGSG